MQVTKLEDAASIKYKAEKCTKAALKNEHDYLVAERLTKNLLEKGLIFQDEFNKIMARNRPILPSPLAYSEGFSNLPSGR